MLLILFEAVDRPVLPWLLLEPYLFWVVWFADIYFQSTINRFNYHNLNVLFQSYSARMGPFLSYILVCLCSRMSDGLVKRL